MAKSKPQLRIKGSRGRGHKQPSKIGGTNKVWLRSRRRIRKKILGR